MQERRVVVKNLDGWSRWPDAYSPTVQVEFDAQGHPAAAKNVLESFKARHARLNDALRQQYEAPDATLEVTEDERKAILAEHASEDTIPLERVRWQVHPETPLETVAWFTGVLTGTERSEIWTSQAVFIVGGPNYGFRRLKTRDGIDVMYRSTDRSITRNGKAWSTATSAQDAARMILADLAAHSNVGTADLYFDFSPSSSWADAEAVICGVLPELDGMRGLWLGVEKRGRVTLHFHDVWKDKWGK